MVSTYGRNQPPRQPLQFIPHFGLRPLSLQLVFFAQLATGKGREQRARARFAEERKRQGKAPPVDEIDVDEWGEPLNPPLAEKEKT